MKELTKKRLKNHRLMPASRFHMTGREAYKKGRIIKMADGKLYQVMNDGGTLRRVREVS